MPNRSTVQKRQVLIAPYPRTMAEIFSSSDLDRLERFVETIWARDEPLPERELEKHLPSSWALVAHQPVLDLRRVRNAPALKAVIEVAGHFAPDLDYAACFERSIHVLSCAPAFGNQVAEMALAMALASGRGLIEAHLDFLGGCEEWQGDDPTNFTLFNETVGLIGFGAIARKLRHLLAPFGCRIQVFDPWLDDASITSAGCMPVSLDKLLASSRVVFVLAAPTPDNEHLLGAPQFASMPQGALLVLISRSHLVDFEALISAVTSGRIQAAIDVFPVEPVPPYAEVRRTPHALLSPHRGASIRKERQIIGRMTVDDLQAIAAGSEPSALQRADPELIQRRLGHLRIPPAAPTANRPDSGELSSSRPLSGTRRQPSGASSDKDEAANTTIARRAK